MDGRLLAIKREVLSWPGVEQARGRVGAVALRYGGHELGQLHLDYGVADLPVTPEIRERLLSEGRARPRRDAEEGYVSYPVDDDEDVAVALEILGWNYDRAKGAEGQENGG